MTLASSTSARNPFQFTPLREGRLPLARAKATRSYFNSRPSARGDGSSCCRFAHHRSISIHAPPRGATRAERRRAARDIFQFTPLREGRLEVQCMRMRYLEDFNSRPSARGDALSYTNDEFAPQFQFTPLREGRLTRRYSRQSKCISIHAPPRGATYIVKKGEHAALFQFTPLREGRRGNHQAVSKCQRISIHAPPRGATAKDMQFLQIFCSTLTNQHGLTIVPRNLSRLFW